MKTLLVINPGSRSGGQAADDIVDQLAQDGEVEQLSAEHPTDLPDLLRQQGGRADRIVLGGGDGTVNLMLDSLLELGKPVGLLPLGTANDLARSLEIPTDTNKALAIIRAGVCRRIDVAQANQHSFINALGMGLGPRMTEEMDGGEKSRFGVLAYLLGIVRAFRRQPSFSAQLHTEDRQRQGRFLQITVASGIHYGGGMTVAEDAKLDDREFDVLLVPQQSHWRLLANAISFRQGLTRNADGIIHLRCQKVQLDTQPTLDVTLDGEFLTQTPVCCSFHPRSLQVFAPTTS